MPTAQGFYGGQAPDERLLVGRGRRKARPQRIQWRICA